jgi:hypothetical protein
MSRSWAGDGWTAGHLDDAVRPVPRERQLQKAGCCEPLPGPPIHGGSTCRAREPVDLARGITVQRRRGHLKSIQPLHEAPRRGACGPRYSGVDLCAWQERCPESASSDKAASTSIHELDVCDVNNQALHQYPSLSRHSFLSPMFPPLYLAGVWLVHSTPRRNRCAVCLTSPGNLSRRRAHPVGKPLAR